MRSLLAALLAAVAPGPDGPDPAPAVAAWRALADEYEAASAAWDREHRRADVVGRGASPPDLERRFLAWPGWAFAPRFVAFAEAREGDPAVLDALVYFFENIGGGVSPNDVQLRACYDRAIAILAARHLDDPKIESFVHSIRSYRGPATEGLLRSIADRGRNSKLRALACVAMGSSLVGERDLVVSRFLEADPKPPFEAFVAGRWDPDVARQVRRADPAALEAEAGRWYERAIREHGDETWWADPADPARRESVAKACRTFLNAIRVAVGKPAPEIEGADLDGKPMKLGDFRGKVVLLAFWGGWCPPCVASIPAERALVARLPGDRFVLLGVNADDDAAKGRELARREGISWRSWHDGRPPGPIATGWAVRGWPTFWVIDPEGIIRSKSRSLAEGTERVLDDLLPGAPGPPK